MWLLGAALAFGIIVMISISWPTSVGAPWVPTSMNLVQKMLELAEVGSDDVVYDLGCGDGRIVFTAARVYKARAVGIEIDPLRYLWCQFMVTLLGLRDRVTIKYGSFFSHDLSEATVVTCYLLSETNLKLEKKLKDELRPGTRVVSNTFTFLGLDKVREDGEARMYLCNS
jgi:predicted RNA methylase